MLDQDEEVPGGVDPPQIGKAGGDQARMALLPLSSL